MCLLIKIHWRIFKKEAECIMITRQKLIDQIEKYKPYNEQEEKDKILILDWIRNNENAFSRENAVAHMTASAWVVNKDIHHHRKQLMSVLFRV